MSRSKAHSTRFVSQWKDFNSPLARNEIWVRFCQIWYADFDLPFAPFGIASTKNAISYFVRIADIHRVQSILVDRVMQTPAVLTGWIRKSEQYALEMNRYTARIHTADLTTWSAPQLRRAYERFADLQARQYAIGILLVALDTSFGPCSLDSTLTTKLPAQVQKEAYELFTRPCRDSFSREQEHKLMRFYATLASRTRASLASKHGEQLPLVKRALQKHAATWAWVYYVYAGPAWTADDFFAVLKDWSRRKVNPRHLLSEWKKERETLLARRKRFLKRADLSQKEKRLLSLIGDIVWSKPHRKDHQSKSYWHMETWFREVARRLSISLREARSMPQTMLWESLKKGRADAKVIDDVYTYHISFPTKTGVRILSGARAQTFFHTHVHEETVVMKGTEFRGTTACPGRARGRARIINTTDDMEKMRGGDILVSVATTPSIVSAMRKASAILTDEGGLTCHAAIVSRELNIPCVVGLHAITSAVKDGDVVDIDAGRGIVNIVRS